MFESFLKPPISFPTLTGSIVTFNAQYALPLKSHTVALTATQSGSGTPSPQNIRNINGWSAIGISQTDSNYTTYADLTIPTSNTNAIDIATIPVVVGKTYTIYCEQGTSLTSSTRNTIYLSTPDGTVIEDNTANYYNGAGCHVLTYTCATAGNMTVRYWGHTPSTTLIISNIIISDSVFNTSIINLGGTYYFGLYDARTGLLMVTHLGVDMGSLTWERRSNTDYYYFRNITNITNIKNGVAYQVGDIRCSIYEAVQSAFSADFVNYKMFLWTDGKIYLRNDDYTDANAFKTAMSGINLVYELATPTTIQLPPCPIDTLEGVNNIWADTGNTTLQYPKFG